LIERLGWRAPWAVLIGFGLLGIWLTRAGLPPGQQTRRADGIAANRRPFQDFDTPPARPRVGALVGHWRGLLRRRSVASLLLTSLLLSAAMELPFIVYGAWLETAYGLSLTALGLMSVVVGLAEATAEFGTAVLTDRLGKKRSVLLGLLGLAAGLVALPSLAALGLAPALAGLVGIMLAFEFGIVSLLPLATELAPDARASLLSLNITALSLGRIMGAVAGGRLWEWLDGGIAPNALAGAVCALVAALIMAWGMVEIEVDWN
jgi:predicted MFS family arabinose efflux permease